MTKDEIIEYIADLLWSRGMGSKAGALEAATVIVSNLIAHGSLKVVQA